MGKNGERRFSPLTPHLYNRMTVDLNNLVVLLWKQELAYTKNNKNLHNDWFLITHLFWCFSKIVWRFHTAPNIVH